VWPGCFKDEQGNSYSGEFKNGKLNGKGKINFINGNILKDNFLMTSLMARENIQIQRETSTKENSKKANSMDREHI
jgi:hypothetical protein